MIALRLSKAGYGTPQEILNMRVDLVLAAVQYEKFVNDYEEIFVEMNKETKA